jgi:predicted Zn-dependent peptidase
MRVAGGSNAETLPHFMYFDRVCPVETIGAALDIERGRMIDLRFDQGDVVREGPRCAEEVDAVAAGEGMHLAKFALMAAGQGWRHGVAHANVRTGLEAIPAEDARRFIASRLGVAGCTLVLVADLPEDALREAGVRALEGLPGAGPRPAPVFPDWSRQPKQRAMTWDVRARGVFVCAPAPADPVERAALSLYAAVMAERLASATPRGARSIASTSPAWPMGELPFLLFAALPEGASAEDAVADLHAFLDKELERGVTEADLAALRSMAAWFTPGAPTPNAAGTIEAARRRAGEDAARAEAMAVGNIALRHAAADQFERQGAPAAEAAKLSAERLTEVLRATLARDKRFVTTLGPK